MKFKITFICIFCISFLVSCQPETVGYTGPSINAGPVTISAHINSNGEIVLDGSYSQLLYGTEELGLNWDIGFETTLNKASTKQYTLFILYQDNSNHIVQQEYAINKPFEINFSHEQWVRKIHHDGSGNIIVAVENQMEQTNTNSDNATFDNSGDNSSSAGTSCPGAPEQRLEVNGKAYVCTASETVKLREGPGKTYSVIKSLVPGADLDVIGGPKCSDDWSWWQVRTERGFEGWMSEGGDSIDTYFLCPRN